MLQGVWTPSWQGRVRPSSLPSTNHGRKESHVGVLVLIISVCQPIEYSCRNSLTLRYRFAMFVGKMDTMKWTDYMDECLEIFEKSPEIPTDETLAVLVRLQRINDEAQELLVKDAMADVGGTPTWMFRKGMKERLDN